MDDDPTGKPARFFSPLIGWQAVWRRILGGAADNPATVSFDGPDHHRRTYAVAIASAGLHTVLTLADVTPVRLLRHQAAKQEQLLTEARCQLLSVAKELQQFTTAFDEVTAELNAAEPSASRPGCPRERGE